MRPLFVYLALFPFLVAADRPPLKVTVEQLLAHPQKYDRKRVDVTGYYTAGMEDSQLWPSVRVAATGGRRMFEESVFIDPSVYGPPPPRHIPHPDKLKNRMVRIIGTFHARRLESGVSTAPDGPNIRKASYFQPIR